MKPNPLLSEVEPLNPSVGQPIKLQRLTGQSHDRFDVRVIGHLRSHSLLVTAPRAGALPATVRIGEEYAVRYLEGTHIVAFRCRVLKVVSSPYHYLHLSWPDQVDRIAVREAERIPVRIEVALQGLQETAHYRGVLLDLSPRGALLECEQSLQGIGNLIRLDFQLTFGDLSEQIVVAATIRNRHEVEEAERLLFRFGLRFERLETQARLFLQGFIFEQLARKG